MFDENRAGGRGLQVFRQRFRDGNRAMPSAGAPNANGQITFTFALVPRQNKREELARALDAAAHETEFARLRSLGHELPALYLELLAPAARQIGRLWETDDCTFPEVTLALWRIQSLVQSLAEEFCAEPEFRQPQRRILLSPAPGSQHTLGFYMLTQFFRRAGWSACAEIEAQPAALIDAVRSDWYDVAAVSVSNSAHLDALSQLIREVRSASLNPGLGIMVGGPLVFDASVRAMLGAEAYSGDALDALRAADRLIQERAQPN